MTRPSGRRRLPAVFALALLCLVARCGGEATAAGRHALQTHPAGLVAPARRFGLPRRLAQAAEGEDESSASELDSSALLEEEEEAEQEDDSSGLDEMLDDLAAALDGEDSTALGDGDDSGVLGGEDGVSDGEDGEDSDLLLSSDDGLFDDEEEEDDGFDWSSDLRLWGDDEDDEDDDRFGAQALLDDSALFSDDAGFSDESIFDFWAEDDELPPDFGARRRVCVPAPAGRGMPVALGLTKPRRD